MRYPTVLRCPWIGLLLVGGSAAILGPAREPLEAANPFPEASPGEGIVVRTEVTAVWLPRALLLHQADLAAVRSREQLESYLTLHGLRATSYALTYRGHQVDGGSADLTQVRRADEWAAHFAEFQGVFSTAVGRPPNQVAMDFSGAEIRLLPESGRPR